MDTACDGTATAACDAKQAEAIAQLSARLKAMEVEVVPPPGESSSDTLLRFLNARQGNVQKAADFLAADAAWRSEQSIDELRALAPSAILGSAEAEAAVGRTLPIVFGRGVDRCGRPIVYKHFGGQCRFARLLEHTSLEQLGRYNTWLNEQLTLCLRDAAASRWTVVIDAAGWHMGLADRTGLALLRQMADVDANHYPERLAHIIVVNAPPMIAACWRIIRTWLDDVTKAKVDIIAEKRPEAALARLDAIAAPEQRPSQYGGTGAALEGWPARGGLPPPKAAAA